MRNLIYLIYDFLDDIGFKIDRGKQTEFHTTFEGFAAVVNSLQGIIESTIEFWSGYIDKHRPTGSFRHKGDALVTRRTSEKCFNHNFISNTVVDALLTHLCLCIFKLFTNKAEENKSKQQIALIHQRGIAAQIVAAVK